VKVGERRVRGGDRRQGESGQGEGKEGGGGRRGGENGVNEGGGRESAQGSGDG